MRATMASLTGALLLVSGAAMAHTTDFPHSHPHIMDLSVGSSLLAAALFSVSVALVLAARRAAIRRRK
ncbi:MAG: hypothetical protein AAGB04_27655 [Pseudomonadota bacterium]